MKVIMFVLAVTATLTLAGCDIEVDAQTPAASAVNTK